MASSVISSCFSTVARRRISSSLPIVPSQSQSHPSSFATRNSPFVSIKASNAERIQEAFGSDPSSTPASASSSQVQTGIWIWRGYRIRYQYAGTAGPALVLIHGFGANSDHWRKNIPFLAASNSVYAIDLIGYGYSDKPNPRELGGSFYTFDTWADQLNSFCSEVVGDRAFFICNSIGGLVGLQAAVTDPSICKGIVLLDISLRMLHIKKQPWYGRPFIKSFQSLLRNTPVGKLFFNAVATSDSVKSILCQCYHDTSAVTDELVQIILQPGLDPGAADVFLEFICYSDGPLPEELLPKVECPVLVAWGEKDPWEPVELGRAYADFKAVEDFIVLPNVGHCPQDEAPDLVNPMVESFVRRHN
ncbi:alpha/beta-Hydrolases superfamily protein [Rhynchospora pubera]|uniref:Alpha/beta-Hydrolases superfamily protein n=1 Tax=Rhynchospora pubera TaxID=906938 RepID=A0AAV8F090_9POAL|nr:alpha/beta-Hydrolases superfamily protein [Rhynchospora pubera]